MRVGVTVSESLSDEVEEPLSDEVEELVEEDVEEESESSTLAVRAVAFALAVALPEA